MYRPFDRNPLEPNRDDHGVGTMFWFSVSFLIAALALIVMRYI